MGNSNDAVMEQFCDQIERRRADSEDGEIVCLVYLNPDEVSKMM